MLILESERHEFFALCSSSKLAVYIGISLIRRWSIIRRHRVMSKTALSMIVRIMGFSLYGLLTLTCVILVGFTRRAYMRLLTFGIALA